VIQPVQGKLKQEKTNDCCTTCGKIDAEENLVLCHCRSTLFIVHIYVRSRIGQGIGMMVIEKYVNLCKKREKRKVEVLLRGSKKGLARTMTQVKVEVEGEQGTSFQDW
jgi:hypothetical protein